MCEFLRISRYEIFYLKHSAALLILILHSQVVSSVLKGYPAGPIYINRGDAGTEEILDKSVVMEILASSVHVDTEGINFKPACYYYAAALLSALNWIEKESWDPQRHRILQ